MALDRQTTIPSAITAGTDLRLEINTANLPASAGGSIIMYLRGPGDIPAPDFTYGTDDDAFTIDALAAATTNWPAGIYEYTIKHTDTAGIKDLVDSGRLEVMADPANESIKDARTFIEIYLSRLKEQAKELALNPYKTIQIGDTIYSSHNPEELNKLIDDYEAKLVREKFANLNQQGKDTQYDISVEFTD